MRETNFSLILYHNNHTVKRITVPSLFRKLPQIVAYCGLAILFYVFIQFGMKNYAAYASLNIAYESELQQVETMKTIHEKVITLRDKIQNMYTK